MKLPVAPVPCEANKEFEKKIVEFAKELECQAHTLSGLGKDEFDRMGLFRAAIERLRGQQAARKGDKREFVETVLNYLKKTRGRLTDGVSTDPEKGLIIA